jgi:hypothetical protein
MLEGSGPEILVTKSLVRLDFGGQDRLRHLLSSLCQTGTHNLRVGYHGSRSFLGNAFQRIAVQDDITQVPGVVGGSSVWALAFLRSLHLYHEYYHLIKYKRGSKFNKSKEMIEI